GQYYEEIKDKTEKENDIKLDADFEYNNEYGYGIIFWQEVKAGKQFDKGATIKVRVSKGTPTSEVPDYTGYELEEYKSLLDDLNIEYTEISEINMDYVDGYVIRVDPEPGYEIEINSGEIVTIYYASNPEPTEEPTEAPTEAPTSEPDPIDSDVDSTEPVE
ncbi:MAG: PASTA domain-containing protein, partial [Oscillospiraceae bacterium]|nr:PASTA domain-containing protein [Oscillospiraceae bacterium]